jgi:two-component system CheB/CheR fusion protein
MLLTHSNLFSPLDLKHRIFSKVTQPHLRERLLVLAQTGNDITNQRLSRYTYLREAAFDAVPVAQVVVDLNSVLVLASRLAQHHFGLSTKDLGRPFYELEISYRPVELRSLMEQACAEQQSIKLTEVSRSLPTGETQYLDVQVVPLQDNNGSLVGAASVSPM